MGFLDKAKSAAGQAAAKAKEGVEDVQHKRELSQAEAQLGKVAFELVESGQLEHERLRPLAERISALNERSANDEEEASVAASDEPPPMPS